MTLAIIFLVGAAVGAFGGYTHGWNRGWLCGENTGRAKQWADDFIAAAARNRARRQRNGQFKSTRPPL